MSVQISDTQQIGIVCSSCSHETRKTIAWIRIHTQLECPNCGGIISVESRNFRVVGSPAATR